MLSFKQWLLGAAVLIFVGMSVGLYWQHSKIGSQARTISEQADKIGKFEKDKKGQEKADKKLQADKETLAKERDKFKKDLENALKNSPCADVPFDANTQRLLEQLYNSKSSR